MLFDRWFMGKLVRKDTERLLLASDNVPGTYLIRESESNPGNHAINTNK